MTFVLLCFFRLSYIHDFSQIQTFCHSCNHSAQTCPWMLSFLTLQWLLQAVEVGHGESGLHVCILSDCILLHVAHPVKKYGRWIKRTGRQERKDWKRADPCPCIACCSHIPLKSLEDENEDETDKITFPLSF